MEWFVKFAQQSWAPYVVIVLVVLIVVVVKAITNKTGKR